VEHLGSTRTGRPGLRFQQRRIVLASEIRADDVGIRAGIIAGGPSANQTAEVETKPGSRHLHDQAHVVLDEEDGNRGDPGSSGGDVAERGTPPRDSGLPAGVHEQQVGAAARARASSTD